MRFEIDFEIEELPEEKVVQVCGMIVLCLIQAAV